MSSSTSAPTPTPASAPTYGSFVIRWRRRPEPERIEVEHVQSGHRTRVSSVARAVTWMQRRMDGDVTAPLADVPGSPAAPGAPDSPDAPDN